MDLDVTGVPQCHLQFFPSSKGCQMLENMALPEDRWITSGCFCLLTTSKYVSSLNPSSKQQATKVPVMSHVQSDHMELSCMKVRQFKEVLHINGLFPEK